MYKDYIGDHWMTEFEFVANNEPEFYNEYGNCYMGVHEHEILGVYQTYDEAHNDLSKLHKADSYNIYTISDMNCFSTEPHLLSIWILEE